MVLRGVVKGRTHSADSDDPVDMGGKPRSAEREGPVVLRSKGSERSWRAVLSQLRAKPDGRDPPSDRGSGKFLKI